MAIIIVTIHQIVFYLLQGKFFRKIKKVDFTDRHWQTNLPIIRKACKSELFRIEDVSMAVLQMKFYIVFLSTKIELEFTGLNFIFFTGSPFECI